MTREEFEQFAEVATEVGASYAVCQWPERFKELIASYREVTSTTCASVSSQNRCTRHLKNDDKKDG
jgi:hypothetical protein